MLEKILITTRNKKTLEFWKLHLPSNQIDLKIIRSIDQLKSMTVNWLPDTIILDTYFNTENSRVWLQDGINTINKLESAPSIVCISPAFAFITENKDNMILGAECMSFGRLISNFPNTQNFNQLSQSA